jgi:hypothetical protein
MTVHELITKYNVDNSDILVVDGDFAYSLSDSNLWLDLEGGGLLVAHPYRTYANDTVKSHTYDKVDGLIMEV